MNHSSRSLGSVSLAALVPVCLALGSLFSAQEGTRATGSRAGLRRVAPDAALEESRDLARAFAKDFVRDEWRARLAEPDLDRRERSFELLLRRARLDPVARAFVEEVARDARGGELAWTARMALRQLGPTTIPLHFGLTGPDPFDSARRMRRVLQELVLEHGPGFFPVVPLPLSPRNADAPQGLGANGRSVQVEQGPRGARIRITEELAGQAVPRTFEGSSLEEILRAHPELERELAGLPWGSGPSSSGPWSFAARGSAPLLVPQGRSRPIIADRLGVIVQALTPARRLELGLGEQGLWVARTYPETYAQLLGVGAGSILLELDGTPLSEVADIERVLRARSPDAPLRLEWLDVLGQRQKRTWKPDEER